MNARLYGIAAIVGLLVSLTALALVAFVDLEFFALAAFLVRLRVTLATIVSKLFFQEVKTKTGKGQGAGSAKGNIAGVPARQKLYIRAGTREISANILLFK